MIIYKDLNFKYFNTLHINNIINCFFEVENHDEIYILKYLFDYFNLQYYVIGNASKVLFKDYVVDKPIIYINHKFSELYYLSNNKYIISSGLLLKDLIMFLKDLNKGGFQSLYPIPATVGGMIVNNASDNKVCFSSFLEKVMVIDECNKIQILSYNDLCFSYRKSIFKEKKYIILYALIKVIDIRKELILNDIKKSIIYRNINQGSYKYSCGSLFKNDESYKAYEVIKKINLDKIKINDIHFSDIHCNILINDNNATSKDVILLVKLIKEKAKKELNIDLLEELIIY